MFSVARLASSAPRRRSRQRTLRSVEHSGTPGAATATREIMRVHVERASAFDRYLRGENSSAKIIVVGGGAAAGHRRLGAIHVRGSHGMLPDLCCYMCIEMARDTPGSPMPRPRDLGAGGGGAATATLTSGAYHAATTDSASLHDHELQQKMLKVTYDRCVIARGGSPATLKRDGGAGGGQEGRAKRRDHTSSSSPGFFLFISTLQAPTRCRGVGQIERLTFLLLREEIGESLFASGVQEKTKSRVLDR